MKKYKLILLIVFMFILSGCNINYSVNIRSNGEVLEKFVMSFDEKDIDSSSPKSFIEDKIKTYKENNIYKDYKFEVKISGNKSKIIASKKYSSLNDYINKSEILPIMFEKTVFTGDYDIKGLQTVGEYYQDVVFDSVDGPGIENIDIDVHSQFKILDNNAESIDDNNTMHWNVSEENKNFSINFKFNNSKRYDIIIKDYLKENWVSLAAVLVIIVSIIIVVKYIKSQNKLNNKI